jgi:hypothetical protein
VVADIDIRFSFLNIFLAFIAIMNKIQHAEYPRPQCQKFVADPPESLSEEKWQDNSGQ